MHLKQKGYFFGVLLIYTITTITLSSVGRCELHSSQTNSHSALHNVRRSVLTTKGLTRPSNRERLHLDSRPGEESRNLAVDNTANRDGTETSAGPEHTQMASTGKNRHKPKRSDPPNKECNKGNIEHFTPGKFYITGQLETTPRAYQSDSATVQVQGGQQRVRGQRPGGSEESWQRLKPVVDCGDDAMTLTVRRRRAAQLQLARVNESSVPLSRLPPQCGYSMQTTWRDLSLMARYDACHVTREEDSYVLPLLWRGTPVEMSCPAPQSQPQAPGPSSLCCSARGMTVKVQGLYAAEHLRVNVRGEWTPLGVLAEQCGYTVEQQDADTVIAAPFIACGVTVKDGKYTLSLQMGEKTFTAACPVSPPEELPVTHQPVVHNPHRPISESLEPYPWAPPFYLAPPYYPHPTYYHNYPRPDAYSAPSSSTPEPTFSPQPLPPDASQLQDYPHQVPAHVGVLSPPEDVEDSSHVHPDRRETPVLGVSMKPRAAHSPSSDAIQVEAPPLQPPSHAFNPYYHYYHHPKIPLPGPEVPGEPSLPNPHDPEIQSEAVRGHQFLQPGPEDASLISSLPESPPKPSAAPHPPQPYPHHYYYFPHIARGEAKRLPPLNLDAAPNLSDMLSTSRPLPRSSRYHDLDPYVDSQHPDAMMNFQKNSPELIQLPLLSGDDDVKAELDDRKGHAQPPLTEQLSFPPPSPNHNLPLHPYHFHHPYYYYYQMYFGNRASPTSSNEASDPPLQTSSSPQNPSHRKLTPPPAKSVSDVHSAPLHPHYYYHHLNYQPEVSVDTHMNSGKAPKSESPLPSDISGMDWLVHAADAGYPSIPQPLHSLNSHYITQQQPYHQFGLPGGDEAEERLDSEMKDHLQASPSPPSARPCGLGSDFHSLGCCSYPVKDCTLGQYLIFAVQPTAARPSELSNVSCTLQKLTSDPDIYTVPLGGCGVNKHVFGETVLHLLEVHGLLSLQHDRGSELQNAPLRLMVGCSASPGSPGEVRLHLMDPPPPVQSTPATVIVQLRIATDESFTSFHPEAHLPLSLMRGRAVHVQLSLLQPPEPGLLLLVHSCLAYARAPYTGWMLVYDGCPGRGDAQLLPSPRSDPLHTRRILISGFQSLPSESPSYRAEGESAHLEDPEIYFMCLTEVCYAADEDCTVSCIHSPSSDV